MAVQRAEEEAARRAATGSNDSSVVDDLVPSKATVEPVKKSDEPYVIETNENGETKGRSAIDDDGKLTLEQAAAIAKKEAGPSPSDKGSSWRSTPSDDGFLAPLQLSDDDLQQGLKFDDAVALTQAKGGLQNLSEEALLSVFYQNALESQEKRRLMEEKRRERDAKKNGGL